MPPEPMPNTPSSKATTFSPQPRSNPVLITLASRWWEAVDESRSSGASPPPANTANVYSFPRLDYPLLLAATLWANRAFMRKKRVVPTQLRSFICASVLRRLAIHNSARVGPTTPLSVTRAGVRLVAIGKGVKRAFPDGEFHQHPGALRPI